MFLKLMSAENVPDSDSRKTFRLLDRVDSVFFFRSPLARVQARVQVTFTDRDVEEFPCEGNAYLMNDGGRTVATFGVSKLP